MPSNKASSKCVLDYCDNHSPKIYKTLVPLFMIRSTEEQQAREHNTSYLAHRQRRVCSTGCWRCAWNSTQDSFSSWQASDLASSHVSSNVRAQFDCEIYPVSHNLHKRKTETKKNCKSAEQIVPTKYTMQKFFKHELRELFICHGHLLQTILAKLYMCAPSLRPDRTMPQMAEETCLPDLLRCPRCGNSIDDVSSCSVLCVCQALVQSWGVVCSTSKLFRPAVTSEVVICMNLACSFYYFLLLGHVRQFLWHFGVLALPGEFWFGRTWRTIVMLWLFVVWLGLMLPCDFSRVAWCCAAFAKQACKSSSTPSGQAAPSNLPLASIAASRHCSYDGHLSFAGVGTSWPVVNECAQNQSSCFIDVPEQWQESLSYKNLFQSASAHCQPR